MGNMSNTAFATLIHLRPLDQMKTVNVIKVEPLSKFPSTSTFGTTGSRRDDGLVKISNYI